MNNHNLKPTPRFEQLNGEIITPTNGIKQELHGQWMLPMRKLIFRQSDGEERPVFIYRTKATISEIHLEQNGIPYDPIHRTQILMELDQGIILITLNRELLLPIANHEMQESPWNFNLRVYPRSNEVLSRDYYLTELPRFDNRQPSTAEFEKLFDPKSPSELNCLRIVADLCVFDFWDEGNEEFDVFLGSTDSDAIFTYRKESMAFN